MTTTKSNHHASQYGRASSLLRSKLRRPAVAAHFVRRPRLDSALEEVTDQPVTLVIAPPGSGKTQLLSNWMSSAPMATTWLSLEATDDDPAALWSGVIGSLDALAPSCGRAALPLIVGGTPANDVVRSLLNDLEAVVIDDAVLILDDVHHLRSPVTTESLSLFVRHLPSWLHVVIAGRTDPAIPLDRMRGQGWVRELRFAELRFTPSETREMLSLLAPTLSDDEIDASTSQTDGWAAGVQLAALAARSAQTQASSTPDQSSRLLIEDYVRHEVLAAGDPAVVDLLMRVSVVDRINGPLAAVIAGRPDAHELLLSGEAQGLFVYRLGTEGWFRIHPLVREALHHELVRRDAHREHHARAAQWLEDAAETVEALNQWLLAEQPREALRLLAARSTGLYDEGREAVIGRTLAAIPREVTVTDVRSLIDSAVSRILGPLSEFRVSVREAAWHAERTGGDYAGSIDALEAMAHVASGSWRVGAGHAHRSLAELGHDWWSDPAGQFSWNTACRAIALSEWWDDDDPTVRDATMAMSRDPRRGMSLEGIRALGHAFAGRPIQALRVAAGVQRAADTMSILRVELGLAEGIARLEIGDRERGVPTLRSMADDESQPRAFAPVAARLALARLALDDGELDVATAELGRADALVTAIDGGPDLAAWVRRIATAVTLAHGEIDDARRHAALVDDPCWGPICRAKVLLAADDRAGAALELDDAEARSIRQLVVLGIVRARAATTPDDALGHVAPAVELAADHGMLQTVVSEGRDLVEVIERAAWRVPAEWLHRLRLAMTSAKLTAREPLPATPDVLTEREREVLRLLPSRLTLNEIASELYVSVNTIKFHLRIIYRKLGVNSREEAAAIARSMSQLSPSGGGT